MRALALLRSASTASLVTPLVVMTTTAQVRGQSTQGHSTESDFPPPPPSSSSPLPPSHSAGTAVFPVQQLYKSSHRGSGNVPIPTPVKPRVSGMEAAILGARSSCAEDQGPVPERALTPLQRRQLLFKNKAAFVLTPQALRRVKYLLSQYAANHPEAAMDAGTGESPVLPVGIHIGVRRRGCSGYSYTVNYHFPPSATPETRAKPRKKSGIDDVVVEQDGVMVVVDGDALFYVIGTEMDYVIRNVEEKFTFKNPNQKYSCGCEESFMPFDEDDLDD